MVVKMSVNVNDETRAAILELAERRGVSATTVIHQAVGLYKALDDAQKKGDTIILRPKRGMPTRIVIV